MKKFVTYAVMLAYLTVTLHPVRAQAQQYQQEPASPMPLSTITAGEPVSGGKPKVAVYVSGLSGYSSNEESTLRSVTLNTLVRSGQYQVIERSNIMDAELKKQGSGAVDDDEVVAFGRQTGAQYICISDMTFLRSGGSGNQRTREYLVSVRMIDVETAEVLAFGMVEADIRDAQAMIQAITDAVGKMLNTARPATAADLPKLAVYVTGRGGDRRQDNVLYTHIIEALFARSQQLGTFKVVERSEAFTRQVDREQIKQRSGSVDDSQIARLGKQYGIRQVLVANIDYAMKAYNISGRLIDIETANVLKATPMWPEDSDLKKVKGIAATMVGIITQPASVAEQPASDKRPKIAVYVSGRSNYSGEQESALRSATLNALVLSNRYNVIERSNIIDTELKKQGSGSVDDDEVVAFGRQTGARYICISDMTFLRNRRQGDMNFSDYLVSVRMIDVKTAEVLAIGMVEADIRDAQSMIKAISIAVGRMLNTVRPAKAANLPKLAVYVTGRGGDQRQNQVLYTHILEALFTKSQKHGTFKVVERSEAFTKQIDRELKTQYSGRVDDSQITQLGKQYGIRLILAATIDHAMNAYNISGKMIDIETASVLRATPIWPQNSDLRGVKQISTAMVDEMMGVSAEETAEREAADKDKAKKAQAAQEKKKKDAARAKKVKIRQVLFWVVVIAGIVVVGNVAGNPKDKDKNK